MDNNQALERQYPHRWRAIQMLVLASLFWGLSFPVMKMLAILHQSLLNTTDSWFSAASTVTIRFGIAGLITAVFSWRTLTKMTALEFWHGAGLGLFGSIGLLWQMDGLSYTSAGTSAFLTQSYCLIIPILVAFRDRRPPPLITVLACGMMMAGIGILTGYTPKLATIGRGELETLLGSRFFTGQILWLERPVFSRNNVNNFTTVMFGITALMALPVALWKMRSSADFIRAYSTREPLVLLGILIAACTLVAYVVMNYWQPQLPATEAGLIYGAEPVFASMFALFVPGMLSTWTGHAYGNERLTSSLLLGGSLIVLANVLIQYGHRRR